MKRIYDPKTDTYAFADCSGQITHEQVIQRKFLYVASEMETNPWKKAALKFHYLTFYDHR
jgi:hypothetical protein